MNFDANETRALAKLCWPLGGKLRYPLPVERRREGRRQVCRLRAERLAEAEAWLRQWERFWTTSLDRLEVMLAEEKAR